jgi:hypothetical protein
MTAMLVLLMVGKEKVRRWDDILWHEVHTKFGENPQVRLKVITEGQTH